MQFVSVEFIVFFGGVFLGFHLAPLAFRKYYLLFVSYVFYAMWSLPYAVLLLAMTGLAYLAARQIEAASNEKGKSRRVRGAVLLFVLTLCFFKYLEPCLYALGESIPRLQGVFSPAIMRIAVPVGISYYLFKIISYVVDVYWEKAPAEKDFAAFAVYVAFFPQILSGPIQRAVSFLPQIKTPLPVSYDTLLSGMRLLLFGFFKKLVIADRLAIFVDGVYGNPASFNSLTLLWACYAYVFQLYADFSGLTDIARGSAKLFGIDSPKNFDLPFFAPNIQQYWRRWHMTLTQWLGDYVFNPLRMALRDHGQTGLALALMINMVLIGIWHGARTTFLAFGIIHGIYLIVSVMTSKGREIFFKKHPALASIRKIGAPLGVFHLVAFAMIFFRAETLEQAWAMIRNIAVLNFSMASSAFFGKKDIVIVGLGILFMEAIHFLQSRAKIQKIFQGTFPIFRWAAYYALTGAILALGQFSTKDFIYFKF
ncbi:MAG: MBOAT family O-acyltransferase [Candidatus Omnitrophota bacterium]